MANNHAAAGNARPVYCEDKAPQRQGGPKGVGFAAAGLALVLLAGCATPPADPAARAEFEQTNDPLESANRYFFEVNRFLDFLLIRPWADTYRRVVPDFGRERVHNILRNMGEPVDTGNEVLQGRLSDSMISVGRFLVNSTIGIAGIFDVATDIGLPSKEGDFGQTLYSWGVGEGPYLVLPIFGPSNFRDSIGMGVDIVADPTGFAFSMNALSMVNNGRAGAGALDKRSEFIEPLDALEKTSIDFYAQIRSMVRQKRNKDLMGEETPNNSAYPTYDFYNEPTKK